MKKKENVLKKEDVHESCSCDEKCKCCNRLFDLNKFIVGVLVLLFVFLMGVITGGYVLVKSDKNNNEEICSIKNNKIVCNEEIKIKGFLSINNFSLKNELDLLKVKENDKTKVEVLFNLGNVFKDKELKIGYKSIVDELDGMRKISIYLDDEEYSFSLRYDRIQDLNIALFGDYVAIALVSNTFIHDSYLALLDENGNEVKRFENIVSNYVVDEIISEDGVMSFNTDYCPLSIDEDYIRYCYVEDDTFPFNKYKKEITLSKYNVNGEEQVIKTFYGFFSQEY